MKFRVKGYLSKIPNAKITAFYDVIFEECFVVKGFKLMRDEGGVLHMIEPSVKDNFDESGYRKTAHPITKEFRLELVDAMIEDYKKQSGGNR